MEERRGEERVRNNDNNDNNNAVLFRTEGEGTLFCPPIGHRQERGDYQESWQPERLSPVALAEAQRQAEAVTSALGGTGLFGVEQFIQGERVIFSEVSPRPHDTGMVTMATQVAI